MNAISEQAWSRRRILTGASALALNACASGQAGVTQPPAPLLAVARSQPGVPLPKGDADGSVINGDPEIDHCWAQLWAGAATNVAEVDRWTASWPSMADAPDYAHAAAWPIFRNGYDITETFDLTSAVLTRMAETNHFPFVAHDVMLFGLRGCEIVHRSEIGELRETVTLRPRKPSHFEPHCVIGVWRKAEGRLAVCEGSTVPAAYYMRDQAVAAVLHRTRPQCGPDFYSGICNLLPTGWYRYHVGCHGCSSKNWGACDFDGRLLDGALIGARSIPGAFRLDSEATTLRTVGDLIFSHDDVWSIGKPFDNIHAARTTLVGAAHAPEKFSSGGCQVIVGDYDGHHRDQWRRYRTAAGLAEDYEGSEAHKFRYMLLTGHDAMLAARESAYSAASPYALIRQGSSIHGVEKLQRLLNRRAREAGAPFTPLQLEPGFGPRSAFALMRYAPPAWGQRAPIVPISRISAL